MKRIIETSEVLGTVETPEGAREVCISAEANYDEGTEKLIIELQSFLRNTDLVTKEKRFFADWLPKSETVHESVGRGEAVELARAIFQRWERKVCKAAQTLHHV